MRPAQIAVWGALLLLGTACKERSQPRQPEGLAAQAVPTHVDSFVPREVALERFRKGSSPVQTLSGGAPSRDALVRGFLHALETRDTAALRGLVISRDEFAWLYYPTSPQGLPPYSLNPDLMWFMLVQQGNRGSSRAFRDLGGRRLDLAGYRCAEKLHEGANTLWGNCLVRWWQGARADTMSARLFGPILERGGRYKFLSYANKL
jgi:hypothetical protein